MKPFAPIARRSPVAQRRAGRAQPDPDRRPREAWTSAVPPPAGRASVKPCSTPGSPASTSSGSRTGGGPVRADHLSEDLDPVALPRRILAALKAELPEVEPRRHRAALERAGRSAAELVQRRTCRCRDAASPVAADIGRFARSNLVRTSGARDGEGALDGSPLDRRLTFDSFLVGPVQPARPDRGRAGRDGARRRCCRSIQPALHPCLRRPRQDAPAAGHRPCGRRKRTARDLPDGRALHVRLRGVPEGADGASPSRRSCAPSTC